MRRTVSATIAGIAALAATLALVWQQSPQQEPVVAAPSPVAVFHDPRPVAPVERAVGTPERVVIESIGVDERLHGVGLKKDGGMQMPDYGDAAWYDEGPRPGAVGPAVVVAHVRGPEGPDVFKNLKKLRVGATIVTTDSLGTTTFVVDRVEQVDKDELPYDRIWTDTDRPLLRLITCAGTPGPSGFPDNTVVYAHAL